MPLEMAQGNEHIGVHDRPADLGLLHIDAALHRDLHIVGALEAVSNDDLAAGAEGRETVLIGGVHMLQGVLAPAHIERVAVGEEGQAAQALDHVGHYLGIIGTQEGQVARLPKMELDGHYLLLKINGVDPGGTNKALQLLEQIIPGLRPQIGKIDLCLFHIYFSLPCFLPGPVRLSGAGASISQNIIRKAASSSMQAISTARSASSELTHAPRAAPRIKHRMMP